MKTMHDENHLEPTACQIISHLTSFTSNTVEEPNISLLDQLECREDEEVSLNSSASANLSYSLLI